MKFLSTYRKVKDIFVKPRLVWYFGKWINLGNLPVWRRGNTIQLTKNYSYYKNTWYYARLEKSEWTDLGKKAHPIISKIFKPTYILPIWLSFYYFDHDIFYKTKYSDDDFRYEFPSAITIVFFGLCISVTAIPPFSNNALKERFYLYDDYWESILTYLYYKDIKETNSKMGYWSNGEWRFRQEFLKREEDRNELKKYQYHIEPNENY